MWFSKKSQVDGEEWVIAGISIRTSLKLINTKPRAKQSEEAENEEEDEVCSTTPITTTPTSREARISDKLRCPPPPRKRRPALRHHFNGVREFFTPPDLETVFKLRHVEKAN